MKYSLSAIADLTGGALYGPDRTVTALSTDSRNQLLDPERTLFVAIRGPYHDGHQYIDTMYGRGVRAFLCACIPEEYDSDPESGASFLVVADPLRALQVLAAHHRNNYNGTVVAITGSNGKTVVKEWIAQLWPDGAGKLLRSPRSYNSQLGVALSLLMIEGDEQLVVIEAGISEPGEMERLEAMIHPQVGILTNIGEAHRENFGSDDQKLDEKLRLFKGSDILIYNADNHAATRTIEKRFRKSPDRLRPWHGTDLAGVLSRFPDAASQENLGHVLTLYQVLSLTPKPVETLQPVAMRLELREGILGSMLVNDSYNNDLKSLGIALDYLSHNAGSRPRAVILSDILQSNLRPDKLYTQVADMLRAHGITDFTGIGPDIASAASALKNAAQHVRFFDTTEKFLHLTDKARYTGQYVLIKGSRIYGFERIGHFLEKRTHTTTLEVNLTAMTANLNHFRSMLAPGVRTMAMVKAYSYGSGSAEVAAHLQHEGVDYLGVAFADEGIVLREAGIHLPIVVLNADPGSYAVMADYDLEPEIYSFGSLRSYIAEMRSRGISGAPIHLKLDTGMHRLGFMPYEMEELTDILKSEQAVRVRSIFSHLSSSEDPAEDEFTKGQTALFDRLSSGIIRELGDPNIIRHICNSAGITRHPEAHFDMVRLGIGLYGAGQPGLQTVCTLRTQIVQIRELDSGDTVGYNRRGIITGSTRVATIPIGYADGMDRHLGCGRGRVGIRGLLCPTVGNICMDTCMADVSALPEAAEGDEVVIFGEHPTVDDLARTLSTISYEILTSVSARIKRIYIRE